MKKVQALLCLSMMLTGVFWLAGISQRACAASISGTIRYEGDRAPQTKPIDMSKEEKCRDILQQVADRKSAIKENLGLIHHLVAIGSGKGGVGKSTLSMQLASAWRAQGMSITIGGDGNRTRRSGFVQCGKFF